MNDQGELLYKFQMLVNPTGGHYREPMLYGLGSFINGGFTPLQASYIKGDGDNDFLGEEYEAERVRLETWMKAPCHKDDLLTGFTSCNLEGARVNQKVSVQELKQNYGFDAIKANAYFLLPGKMSANEEDMIGVTLVLKNIVVAEFLNCQETENEETQMNVYIPQFSFDDKTDPGYECLDVTVILLQN